MWQRDLSMPRPSTDRPPLRLLAARPEHERFAAAYEAAELHGDYDLRVSLGDQLFVRQQLASTYADMPPEDRAAFAARADRIIELAFYSGIAVALAHRDGDDASIERALARGQEWTV
jgi:hypothetical protein